MPIGCFLRRRYCSIRIDFMCYVDVCCLGGKIIHNTRLQSRLDFSMFGLGARLWGYLFRGCFINRGDVKHNILMVVVR